MSSYVVRKTPDDTEWFRHDRFGMFIHWGLNAMPSRHKWIKNMECITEEKYDWEAEELIATARRLQPGIIIDNRTEIEQDL